MVKELFFISVSFEMIASSSQIFDVHHFISYVWFTCLSNGETLVNNMTVKLTDKLNCWIHSNRTDKTKGLQQELDSHFHLKPNVYTMFVLFLYLTEWSLTFINVEYRMYWTLVFHMFNTINYVQICTSKNKKYIRSTFQSWWAFHKVGLLKTQFVNPVWVFSFRNRWFYLLVSCHSNLLCEPNLFAARCSSTNFRFLSVFSPSVQKHSVFIHRQG